MMTSQRTIPLVCVTVSLFVAGTAVAHPFHVSHGEAHFNATNSSLEVALAFDPWDLERAVQRHGQHTLGLDDAQIEPSLAAYTRDHFRVVQDNGGSGKFVWVGYEVDEREVWVYFELKLAQSPDSHTEITHQMLLELSKQQQNVLTLRANDQQQTLTFSDKQREARLALERIKSAGTP